MTTYNHAYDLCFAVTTSDPDGNATAEQLRRAILARLASLTDEELVHEAVDAPFDTYEETPR